MLKLAKRNPIILERMKERINKLFRLDQEDPARKLSFRNME